MLTHTVVIGTPIDPRRQERARRVCMQRLLFELDQVQVTSVFLETRTQSLNQRDITMVAALRSTGAISDSLTVGFALPDQEPMLWAADAVAGSVGAAWRGDVEPYRALRRLITEYRVVLT